MQPDMCLRGNASNTYCHSNAEKRHSNAKNWNRRFNAENPTLPSTYRRGNGKNCRKLKRYRFDPAGTKQTLTQTKNCCINVNVSNWELLH